MRLRPGVAAVPSTTRCRALVGGFGIPGLRDLDFGRQFVDYAGALDWPADVVVEDLSCAPHLVLHRLQELDPATVVFVGSVERRTGPPGSVRRYRLDLVPPDPCDVHESLTDGLAGAAEFHHTLRVLRHWGALPPETMIVEVEPADTDFGPGFSEEVGSSIEHIVELVRSVLGPATTETRELVGPEEGDPAPNENRARVTDLARYANLQNETSDAVASIRRGMLAEAPDVAGLSIAVRSRPFGTGLHTKGDWYDFIPLADGWLGTAMGDVVERGLEAAIVMSHLRNAVRTAARACGSSPGAVLAAVDRVVADTGLGEGSSLIYLAVHPRSGTVRLANAGHCHPLLVLEEGLATSVAGGWSPRLGRGVRGGEKRPEAPVHLSSASSLLVYTDGLLTQQRYRDDPWERLSQAATTGPRRVGELCDHVMARCLGGAHRRDDASLLVLRLAEESRP